MEKAVAAVRAAVKGEPENREYRTFLYKALSNQAEILAKVGRFDESVKAAEGWAPLIGDDPKELVIAGRVILQISTFVKSDTKDAAALRRRRTATSALDLLKEAVRRGYREAKEFDEQEYEPIRDWPEFQELKAKVKNAQPVVG